MSDTEETWPPTWLPVGESVVRSLYIDVKDGQPVYHPRIRITRIDEDRFDAVPVDEDGLTWTERNIG